MDVMQALKVLRDKTASQDNFLRAVEYLNLYRDGKFVVHYCSVICSYVYVELSGTDMFYLDFLSVV